MELGWTKEFIEGNGIDAELWISPNKKIAIYELPKDFDSPKYLF